VDITQNRILENDLKAAKELAEAATKTKSEFLANMSHEIRTPMNAIIGLTHLVLRTTLTEQQTEYIETAQQSAHILLRLINDILDFSKIEAGRLVLEYRDFSISSLVSNIAAVMGMSMSDQQKNLELQVEVDENIPSAVMGDSVRLHQVISNLLSNAIKFTEKGTIRLHVGVVELDALSFVARFSVSDSGIGITPEQIKNLFKPFSQAHASITRQFGGTGLGLAISRQIVELMHGEISCQSTLGEGTTFTFTARFGIPLKGEVIDVDESTEIRTDALLLGDCPREQATMQHYIQLLGAKVDQAGTELSDFKEILETDKIKAVDFIVFDFSDLRKNFVPIYTAMQEKRLVPMPVCVVTQHPELNSILDELGIRDSVLTLKKPVIAGDLFSIMAKVATHKEELRLRKRKSSGQASSQNEGDVGIPDSIRGAKILLAEDNKINQMVATELLRIEGFETTVAENGRIAVELLQQQNFDLVLMDVQMPEMDGLEATRTIRSDERFKDIPILAMTANAMSGDREVSLEAGMNDHIAKPIEPKVLYSALAKWIRKPQQ
jgi:CheY-like chemotaxis protein/two-component sensor histidine kinase